MYGGLLCMLQKSDGEFSVFIPGSNNETLGQGCCLSCSPYWSILMLLYSVYLPSLHVLIAPKAAPPHVLLQHQVLPLWWGFNYLRQIIGGGGGLVVDVWCVLIWTLCSCTQELSRSRTQHRVQQSGACTVTWASLCRPTACRQCWNIYSAQIIGKMCP